MWWTPLRITCSRRCATKKARIRSRWPSGECCRRRQIGWLSRWNTTWGRITLHSTRKPARSKASWATCKTYWLISVKSWMNTKPASSMSITPSTARGKNCRLDWTILWVRLLVAGKWRCTHFQTIIIGRSSWTITRMIPMRINRMIKSIARKILKKRMQKVSEMIELFDDY